MEGLCALFSFQQKPLRVMDFDGYRMEFDSWWFNIRPSNTEPYLRFICEARTEEELSQKVSQACAYLESEFSAVRS